MDEFKPFGYVVQDIPDTYNGFNGKKDSYETMFLRATVPVATESDSEKGE